MEVPVGHLLTFFLVLSRISGLVLLMPILSSHNLPMRVRAFIALALSLLVTPLQGTAAPEQYQSILTLAPPLANEILLGLMLGLGIRLLFAGVQMTGQLIGHMSGMQLAEVFDPSSGTTLPFFSQLMDLIMVAVFLVIGGHRRVVGALLDSFAVVPIGQARLHEGILETFQRLLTVSFQLGIQIGAPILISLLMSTLILGFISRTLPQLNVIQIGFNLNALVTLLVLSISIGGGALLLEGRFDWALVELQEAIGTMSGGGSLPDAGTPGISE